MRLFISVDMEGIAGVVSWHQLVRGGFEYERAREWLTAEVTVVCEAAFAAGVSDIVIADSHHEGLNKHNVVCLRDVQATVAHTRG